MRDILDHRQDHFHLKKQKRMDDIYSLMKRIPEAGIKSLSIASMGLTVSTRFSQMGRLRGKAVINKPDD